MKTVGITKQPNNLYTITTVETDVPVTVEAPIVVPPEPTFRDDFTSLDLKKTSNGVAWGASNAGSGDKLPVVTTDFLYKGKPSLKFTFGGGVPEDDAWCEQRFTLGKEMSEVWIQYHRYYPSGLELVNVGPKWVHRNAPGSDNNKIITLWGGPYKGYTIAVGIAAWETGGRDVIYAGYGTNQLSGFGQRDLPAAAAQDDSTLGRWVKVLAHFKAATAANNDGVIQYWEDGILKLDSRSIPLYPKDGVGNGFNDGYLMGWSNTGFEQTTHCYVADFTLSDKPPA